MRASRNNQRVSMLQAQENLRLDEHIDAALGVKRYMPYDGNGDALSSPVMEVLRAMLAARLNGTLYDALDGNTDLTRIAELCVPRALTFDEPKLVRGFFQAYAEASMRLATVEQLARWVAAYYGKAEGRNSVALVVLARGVERGLAHLIGHYEKHGIADATNYARYATLTNVARREYTALEKLAWHKLTDSTHAYVGTGKLTRRERAQRHGHHARRKAERANGTPAHH